VLTRIVIVPPYVGVPSESHQFPDAVVVVGVVKVAAVVVVVVAVVVVVVVVDVSVDAVVDVVQDASSIAITNKKLKPNQINLFFNFYPLFYLSQTYFWYYGNN
jgi:nitrate/nitrite transporter NarK